MREFILHDDSGNDHRNENARRMRQRPSHHIIKILLPGKLALKASDFFRRQVGMIDDSHLSFYLPPILPARLATTTINSNGSMGLGR
jgi:hypothetical protein